MKQWSANDFQKDYLSKCIIDLTLLEALIRELKPSISEALMADTDDQKAAVTSKLMHYGMMICCTVMLLPVAAFFLAGGTIAGLWTNLGLFAPIALCIGAHVLMFKMMGKSCHSSKDEVEQEGIMDAEFNEARVPVQEVAR